MMLVKMAVMLMTCDNGTIAALRPMLMREGDGGLVIMMIITMMMMTTVMMRQR